MYIYKQEISLQELNGSSSSLLVILFLTLTIMMHNLNFQFWECILYIRISCMFADIVMSIVCKDNDFIILSV